MHFISLKGKATFRDDDLCCVSFLDGCGVLTDWSPLDFNLLFRSPEDDMHLFLQNNENRSNENAVSARKNFFFFLLLPVKFPQKLSQHLTLLTDMLLRGSDMLAKEGMAFFIAT